MIDTVTFDVWNTLVVHEFYDDRLRIHRMRSIMEALRDVGHNFTWEQIGNAYEYTENSLAAVWKSERDVCNDMHLALFLEGLDLDASDGLIEVIREPYSHALLHFQPRLVEGTCELLQALKQQGYRIGLFSNTGRTPGRTMRKVLEGYGLAGCFDAMTFSDEAGYIKPNPCIFKIALRDLGSEPEKTVHVGDNPLLDVYGARACGISAILFTKYMEQFEKYASKYYCANGRECEPDCRVDALPLIEKALTRLGDLALSRPGGREK
jgi:putative hydrolase of the HAD superfamily